MPPNPIQIIGIDYATDPRKVGLATGVWRPASRAITQATESRTWPAIREQILAWTSGPTVLAIDAPLGWTAARGDALAGHRAGGATEPAPNAMFRRETDRWVPRALGRTPMDVGAGRIALASHRTIPEQSWWHPDLLSVARFRPGLYDFAYR